MYVSMLHVLFPDSSLFLCLDDKHRVKVGEPGVPVAAAEREKQVLVSTSQSFQVCDHDFTRFSLIPTVLLRVDITASMDGSWYDDQVFVGIKEAVFEPSSALRHASEVHDILLTEMGTKSVFCFSTQTVDQTIGQRTYQLSYLLLPSSRISI